MLRFDAPSIAHWVFPDGVWRLGSSISKGNQKNNTELGQVYGKSNIASNNFSVFHLPLFLSLLKRFIEFREKSAERQTSRVYSYLLRVCDCHVGQLDVVMVNPNMSSIAVHSQPDVGTQAEDSVVTRRRDSIIRLCGNINRLCGNITIKIERNITMTSFTKSNNPR